jgi:hypothetical protein
MKYLDRLIDSLVYLAMLIAWIFGIALATGANILGAVLLPPYAWVLLAQALLRHWGLL